MGARAPRSRRLRPPSSQQAPSLQSLTHCARSFAHALRSLVRPLTRSLARRYLWDDLSPDVFTVSNATIGVGFTLMQGGIAGGYGRKVFIKGGTPGTGCFLST